MNTRTIYIFAAVFFLCAGILVFWGIRTDRAMGVGIAATEQKLGQPAVGDFIGALGSMAVVVLVIGFYFFPTFNAFSRRHRERVPIFLVNLLFPVIGWVIALIWSFSSQVEQPQNQQPPSG